MQTIILIRHGYQASWDVKATRQTPPHQRLDPGLADIGKRQAELTAALMRSGGDVDAMVSSPFRRCLETADVIASTTDVAVTPDWRVGEVLLSQVLGSPFSPSSSLDPD